MKSIVLRLDSTREYTELEVNQALRHGFVEQSRRVRVDHRGGPNAISKIVLRQARAEADHLEALFDLFAAARVQLFLLHAA